MSALPTSVVVPAPLPSPLRLVDDCRERLLHRLATQRSALAKLEALPALWGMDADEAAAELAELADAGLVEVWDGADGGPAAILSADTARRFGLTLEVIGERWRWVERGRLPAIRSKARVLSSVGVGGIEADHLPDRKSIDPHAALERLETEQAKPKAHRREVVYLVIGQCLQWPQALTAPVCPACKGELLPFGWTCLPCEDRPVWEDRHKGKRRGRAFVPDPKRAGGKGAAKGRKVEVEKGRGFRMGKRREACR